LAKDAFDRRVRFATAQHFGATEISDFRRMMSAGTVSAGLNDGLIASDPGRIQTPIQRFQKLRRLRTLKRRNQPRSYRRWISPDTRYPGSAWLTPALAISFQRSFQAGSRGGVRRQSTVGCYRRDSKRSHAKAAACWHLPDAAHCVTEAAENGGPLVFARIGVMQAINRHRRRLRRF
jgi:hypothetical protein